jgi:hypothetical protein
MFILVKKASILLQLINKNYDTGQTSTLFFNGNEYLLTTLKSLNNQKKKSVSKFIIHLFEGEVESGLKIKSEGILLDFNAYREFMTINPSFNKLLFLQIKKKNELEIWKNELTSNKQIIPVVSELRTDWLKNIFMEEIPVLFEVSSVFEFPDFIPGYILKKSKKNKVQELADFRLKLKDNYSQILGLLAERRRLIGQLDIIKKENEIDIFQNDVYLNNLIKSFIDSKEHLLPLGDCIDIYMLLHSMSVKQQEES